MMIKLVVTRADDIIGTCNGSIDPTPDKLALQHR
jgi:hypothetical protein